MTKYNLRVKIFRGKVDYIQSAINGWFDSYAAEHGGPPVVTSIQQTEAVTGVLAISIFYNHGEKS